MISAVALIHFDYEMYGYISGILGVIITLFAFSIEPSSAKVIHMNSAEDFIIRADENKKD